MSTNLPLRLDGHEIRPHSKGQFVSIYELIEWLVEVKGEVEDMEFTASLDLIDELINHLEA